MHTECAAYHEEVFRERADEYGPRVRAGIEMGMLIPTVRYLQAQRFRRQLRQDLVDTVKQVDVVLTPATQSPAPRDLNTTGDAMFQQPWTTTGLPTIALPSGRTA